MPARMSSVESRMKLTLNWCSNSKIRDDARSSRAAGVPFIGIATKANPCHEGLVAAMRAVNPFAILEDVNQLEGVLP